MKKKNEQDAKYIKDIYYKYQFQRCLIKCQDFRLIYIFLTSHLPKRNNSRANSSMSGADARYGRRRTIWTLLTRWRTVKVYACRQTYRSVTTLLYGFVKILVYPQHSFSITKTLLADYYSHSDFLYNTHLNKQRCVHYFNNNNLMSKNI